MVTLVDPKTNNVDESRIVDGVIVLSTTKDDWGSIMFREESARFGTGITGRNKKVYFENGKLEDLRFLVKSLGLKVGNVPGYKIVIKESTTPFYEGQSPKINPETQEILTKEGKEIYRTTLLKEINSVECDETVQHDRVEVTLTEVPEHVKVTSNSL